MKSVPKTGLPAPETPSSERQALPLRFSKVLFPLPQNNPGSVPAAPAGEDEDDFDLRASRRRAAGRGGKARLSPSPPRSHYAAAVIN